MPPGKRLERGVECGHRGTGGPLPGDRQIAHRRPVGRLIHATGDDLFPGGGRQGERWWGEERLLDAARRDRGVGEEGRGRTVVGIDVCLRHLLDRCQPVWQRGMRVVGRALTLLGDHRGHLTLTNGVVDQGVKTTEQVGRAGLGRPDQPDVGVQEVAPCRGEPVYLTQCACRGRPSGDGDRVLVRLELLPS